MLPSSIAPTANLCSAGTASICRWQRAVELDLRRQQWRLHCRVLGASRLFAGEWRVRLGKWRRRQQRADQRALHNWFILRRQRAAARGIWSCAGSSGGSAGVLLGASQIRLEDPTSGVLPSYNDASANWKNAGLLSVGGIPNRTTVCATVNPLGGGQDDFTKIQQAINNCPAGEVVQLGAGAFTVHMADLPIQISKGISLRGTGSCGGSSSPYCQTSINVSDGLQPYQPNGPQCGTSTSAEAACPNGGPSVI